MRFELELFNEQLCKMSLSIHTFFLYVYILLYVCAFTAAPNPSNFGGQEFFEIFQLISYSVT